MYESTVIEILRPGAKYGCTENEDGTFTLEWDDTEQEAPTDAEIQAAATEYANTIPMRQLRRVRNKLLAETDWWAMSDRTMTAEQSAYRQALRDLPANTTDPVNPTWPTKP
tara:strand:+ start:190 stop:522 length:333 start_codon:yes stop_codon:yes gene_type:complete